MELAHKCIKELGLDKKPGSSILGKENIMNHEPLLVREEMGLEISPKAKVPYYYLIPFGLKWEVSDDNKPLIRVSVIINAFTGDFEGVSTFGKPIKYLSADDAIRFAVRALGINDENLKKFISSKRLNAKLMYRPSEITHIRAFPFWEVTVGERLLYVDQLGRIYNQIRPAQPGD